VQPIDNNQAGEYSLTFNVEDSNLGSCSCGTTSDETIAKFKIIEYVADS